jgi:hypothetical protein
VTGYDDKDPSAYERLVDRLLASPRFGADPADARVPSLGR